MQYMRFYVITIIILSIICICIFKSVTNNKIIVTPIPIVITNTDTIYQETERLKIKSDTIKLKYETKVNNYHAAPTTRRIQLFSDRINRQ